MSLPDALRACGYQYALKWLPEMLAADAVCGRPAVGTLRDARTEVTVGVTRDGSWLDLGDCGQASFAPKQRQVSVAALPADPGIRAEILYGPVLLHALAWEGIHALHASACHLGSAQNGPAIAIVAASGTGKSTLAAAADLRGWMRIADDVLPYAFDPHARLQLHPHFPQLKLAPELQWREDQPGSLPLTALVQLERGAHLGIEPLRARAAANLVLSNTLASRLYTPAQLALHFACAGHVAQAVSEGRLQAWRLQMPTTATPQDTANAALDLLAAQLGYAA